MNAFRPIWRELAILYYRWARHDMRLKPMDPDLPVVVMRLNDLVAERPRPALRNRCAGMPGMCMHDAACADYDCPGHPWQQIHFADGGHHVHGELSVRIHPQQQPDSRVLLGVLGSLAVAFGCAAAVAVGCPICIPF